MNELDAIHLSDSHGLGSAKNTLVPGVNIPAYVPGTDPDKWIATVKAIGIASHTPTSSAYSLYKPVADVVGSLPGWSGLDNTTVQRKSQEEQNAAITKLADVLASASSKGSGPDRFLSGSWIFGNDFGGMQSNKLADDAQQFRELESNRNYNLAAAAQAFNQQLARQQMERSNSTDAWRHSQDVEANRLALLDRLSRLTQQDFENQLDVSRLNSDLGYNAAYNAAGNAAVDALNEASKQLTPAQQAFNNRMYADVEAYNSKLGPNATEDQKLFAVEGADGIVKLGGGKQSGAGRTSVSKIVSTSPEGLALQRAYDGFQQAQTAVQKVRYTPRPRTTTPQLPPLNFNAEPLLELLTKYGFTLGSVPKTTQQGSKTGSVGYFDPKTGQLIRY